MQIFGYFIVAAAFVVVRCRSCSCDKSTVVDQCDQMARFCFQFWPFKAMQLSPIA